MKKILLIGAISLLCNTVDAQLSKATLQATGLTCAMCSNAINKALEKVPFVESVRSDIKNSAFNIVFKAGSEVDPDQLKKAVEDAGFAVGSLKITGTFDEQAVSRDSHFTLGSLNFHYLGTDNKTLAGEQTLTVVDRDFVTNKEFKKLSSSTKHSCYEDGRAGECCVSEGMASGERVYHVTM